MTKALIYTRFSPRPDADTSQSCEKQADRCRVFCIEKGYKLNNFNSVCDDRNVSGTSLERAGFNLMVTTVRIASKKYKEKVAVIVDSPDRLARDLKVGLILRERIQDAGGILEYADGSPCGLSPEDKFMSSIMMAIATLERDRISFRTSRGMKKRQANGEFFGKPPIGYMRPGGKGTKLVPCYTEREAIGVARELFKKGFSANIVAQKLEDIFGKFRGSQWKAKTVKKMANKTHKWEFGLVAE